MVLCCGSALAACNAAQMGEPPDSGSPTDALAPIPCTVVAPTMCPAPAIRYPDVQPIFQRRCVLCHSDHSQHWPLTTYQHVADWYDTIHDDVLGCMMPPPAANIPITDDERLAILTWLRCGYPP